MLQSLGWAALGTGFTFLMTTLGAATVFFFAGQPKPRFQRTMLGFAALKEGGTWLAMKGKHPADLCPNAKEGKTSCHSCSGSCQSAQVSGNEELVAAITKKVMEQLSK